MKKIVAILLVIAMIAAFAGCGKLGDIKSEIAGDVDSLVSEIKEEVGIDSEGEAQEAAEETESETPAGTEAAPAEAEQAAPAPAAGADFSGYASGKYVTMMQGAYYMEYTTYVMGFEGDAKQAGRGGNTDTITTMMGMTSHQLVLDGVQYDIDDENKKYTKTDLSAELANAAGSYDYTNLVYVTSGNGAVPEFGDVDSASYDYDEYSMKVISGDAEMTITMRYYMKGADLYVIYADVSGLASIMQITSMSSDIPAGMLEVPSGYTEVDSLY